ncbi:hypothetical protein NEOLEDRAFT_1133458 [Neolentinus lepideus HHB14362 ss-1]|uniref:Uncharacterized protein n=1 Tax=Neolentinus lepideus HHB14362 ss-1 TaxID=1314782 RepID=A0A165SQ28_9AGAM|nr:hypothetical protein NEOLEDRAFT_1133458 [Neolentinus lepideus HHB14362 ss-1]
MPQRFSLRFSSVSSASLLGFLDVSSSFLNVHLGLPQRSIPSTSTFTSVYLDIPLGFLQGSRRSSQRLSWASSTSLPVSSTFSSVCLSAQFGLPQRSIRSASTFTSVFLNVHSSLPQRPPQHLPRSASMFLSCFFKSQFASACPPDCLNATPETSTLLVILLLRFHLNSASS